MPIRDKDAASLKLRDGMYLKLSAVTEMTEYGGNFLPLPPFLAAQLSLFEPGGQIIPNTLLPPPPPDFWTVQRLCYLYTQNVNFKTEVTRVITVVMNYKVCNLKGFQAHYIGFKKGKTDRS